MIKREPTAREVLILFALALLVLCCTGGCAFMSENPSDRVCDLTDTTVKYGVAGIFPTLMPVALADLVITRLYPNGLPGSTPATAAQMADAEVLLKEVETAQARLDSARANAAKLADLRKQLADLKAAETPKPATGGPTP